MRNKIKLPPEKITGYIEIGANDNAEVIMNFKPIIDSDGWGHLVFSPSQAINLAGKLHNQAKTAIKNYAVKTGQTNEKIKT